MKEKNVPGYFNNLEIRNKKGTLKIAVLAGGISPEREVSLVTGEGIYQSLLNLGYKASLIDFDNKCSDDLKSFDIAFLALHGKYGEDGTVQGLLELLKIPYTGSGVLSSAMAMDKIFSKKIFIYEKIITPAYVEVTKKDKENMGLLKSEIVQNIGFPVIVKPNRGGSTIGVTILEDYKGLGNAIGLALKYDSKVLIEKYVKGKLLTVSIIGREPVALPVIEIKPESGFYDYQAKYTPGFTEYTVPAKIGKNISEDISGTALKCHRALDCFGLSRVDFILGDDGLVYALEVNTIPGMTPTSLVPKAAAARGIDYGHLVEIILDSACLKL
ncbi:MAG: D-alanine--D-alanine ligase [Actinobacteria bacterium]|nr:D-alanine--D-alanine ligase [Actinomycetota bacterium]